jgi:hypothetical protein
MELSSIPVIAGVASTVIFAASTWPMLAKARRTRNLASYSLGNLSLANVGNAVHSAYVFSLPPGPIWALHSFYVLSSATMLLWAVRYGTPRATARRTGIRTETATVGEPTHGSTARLVIPPDAA